MNALNTKIVLDSSADVPSMREIPASSVPLKIITTEKEYTDNENLNVAEMIADLKKYSGKSSSSCPNPQEFLAAFGEAENVFCITITSALSGSYNAACIAKKEYEEKFPGRRVHVFNTLSTASEMLLIAEKAEEEILAGKSFDEVCESTNEYMKSTGLVFMLESLKNLANNGRVSPIVAKMASVLGIRVVGKASTEGTLEQLCKCRGEKKAIAALLEHMKKEGYNGGKISIAHCNNKNAAKAFCALVEAEFGSAKTEIHECRGLCSFYAEDGGMLVGFEK